MTWELVPTATLVTDAGATVEWAVLEKHIAALAQAEPGSAARITALRPGEEEALTAVQLITLPDGRLAVEVNFSYGTRGSLYQRVKPADSPTRIQRLLVRPGWVARIQKGAILIPAQALDATAWACAEGSLHSSLHTTHVAEDFWADVAAGRRSPP
ncbi:hypothetical protein FHW23_000071 [Curtobacterium pusillum]|uniref:Uncharacterized protein n=1 Tax=Curtobacterium pusillum TaxID=69373 RepID=A0AAW3T0X5_9MICO|nr:hypothetical protein [Curtobacterium pusillum]MBA8988839.1 hypothetical protein [Curtobacterium pusillum]